jgi:hypothetical protein
MITAATLPYDQTPAIVLPVSEWKNPFAVQQVTIPSIDDTSTGEYGEFAVHYAKLKKIANDSSLWASDDAPSQSAITWAYLVIHRFEAMGLVPSKVVASAEGGTAVCFVDGGRYADIESLNSGAILGVLSDKHSQPFVWEIEQGESGIALAADRIRRFLQSP